MKEYIRLQLRENVSTTIYREKYINNSFYVASIAEKPKVRIATVIVIDHEAVEVNDYAVE